MIQAIKLFPECLLWEKSRIGGVQRGRNCLVKCKDEVKKNQYRVRILKFKEGWVIIQVLKGGIQQ